MIAPDDFASARMLGCVLVLLIASVAFALGAWIF